MVALMAIVFTVERKIWFKKKTKKKNTKQDKTQNKTKKKMNLLKWKDDKYEHAPLIPHKLQGQWGFSVRKRKERERVGI